MKELDSHKHSESELSCLYERNLTLLIIGMITTVISSIACWMIIAIKIFEVL